MGSSPKTSAPTASAAGPSSAKHSASQPIEPTTTPAPAVATLSTSPEIPQTSTSYTGPQPKKIPRAQIEAERARKLGERFKITIEPHEWKSSSQTTEAYRVEKPIRMRIHRTCHRCNTTFGANKICGDCQHTRCTKCPRYPVKKAGGKGKSAEGMGKRAMGTGFAAGKIEADDCEGLKRIWVLTRPSKTGGQELVRKKPMQRVRRTCHDCSTLFSPGNKICDRCGHVRCEDCPRDPAKKHKYPDGYPGDAPSSNPTRPLKFTCHQCTKAFPPIPPSNIDSLTPECTQCGHQKCAECPRVKPKKVDPEPDPDVVRSVEAKLAALKIGGSALRAAGA
jgi:hypothetical protein